MSLLKSIIKSYNLDYKKLNYFWKSEAINIYSYKDIKGKGYLKGFLRFFKKFYDELFKESKKCQPQKNEEIVLFANTKNQDDVLRPRYKSLDNVVFYGLNQYGNCQLNLEGAY